MELLKSIAFNLNLSPTVYQFIQNIFYFNNVLSFFFFNNIIRKKFIRTFTPILK